MAAPVVGGSAPAKSKVSTGGAVTGVLLLVFAVFFILGGVTNINDVLITKMKGLYQLTYFQANLVQFAFFTAYALFSIPAGIALRKLGYLRGFVAGFLIVAIGALLFLPAASTGTYGTFLAALFVIGGGITMLQVAMNPIIVTLGDPSKASSRLTFAQFFNSIGVFLMVSGGAALMLGEESSADPSKLSGQALKDFQIAESAIVGQSYVGLAVVMVLIAALFWLFRSALDGQEVEGDHSESFGEIVSNSVKLLAESRRLQFAALCIFMYVGAEVAIGSNIVLYAIDARVLGGTTEAAAWTLSFYWGAAMIGRFLGGFILRIFKPGSVLASAAGINILLLTISAFSSGNMAAWTITLCGLFNSIMFPTIFSLGTQGLNEKAAQASGILCTAIVGGALMPLLFGLFADGVGVTAALIVPVICYAIIASFGLFANRKGVTG